MKMLRAMGALSIVLAAMVARAAPGVVEGPIAIRKVDWILLNARVDLLADALEGRFSRSIHPPSYQYDASLHRIIALSSVTSAANVNQAAFRRALAEAAHIFWLQPHLPEAILSPDPLPDVSCIAEFYQIQGAKGSVKVGSFEIPAPKR